MKRIDCFIPFMNAEQVKNTVAGLKACDLVHNIYLLAGADAQGEVEGCEKIAIGNLNSSDTMKKIAAKADCDYAMLYTKYNSLEFGMFAVERMVKIADDSAAGMAYADHYNVVGASVQTLRSSTISRAVSATISISDQCFFSMQPH